ncbi:hypothetical protein DFR70_1011026 [Nocardia tenerifensis]|uniref:Sulfotransferase family protein n=1 Tax=Nocardia tenerifensis TaxID=228006 RepID=A0A318KH53_9NOCA|nr:hypothetical protein [Nocardia tenerifensis]PXX71592.1 hypothetical protein DFR70_1011026 [Nocardia tenerifensis]
MTIEAIQTTAPATRGAGTADDHVAFCRAVRSRYPLGREGRHGLPTFRRVVVIVSSSRGGSSLLYELLRSTGAFLSLGGEHSVLYKLHGLGLPAGADVFDGTITDAADPSGFRADLAADVTTGTERTPIRPGDWDPAVLADRFVRVLAQQWTPCSLSIENAWAIVHDTIARWRQRACGPTQLLMASVRALRLAGWPIDPWYFDVDPAIVASAFSELAPPAGPPPGLTRTVEAPPFLIPGLAPLPGPADLDRPLLLKASMDAYRLAALPHLFPQSELTVVHLVRNPAAAINGLIDGWRDRGFFSYNLSDRAELRIPGYSGTAGWSTQWWNFDLPPGWRDLIDRPLPLVCAAQWTAAHSHILDALEATALPALRVRAEDVMDDATRQAAIDAILRHCRLRARRPARSGVIMASQRPEPGRWRRRRALLEPIIADGAVRTCALRLGYDPAASAGWK